MLEYEKRLWDRGVTYIAGVDEVGRGSLAGPMVVAAVILNHNHFISKFSQDKFRNPHITNNDVSLEMQRQYSEIKDSKLLTPKKRLELSIFIQKNAVTYSLEILSAESIDKLGLSKCTQIGFFNSVNNLTIKPQHILTDAFAIKIMPENMQTNVINGDTKCITVAAASIIAKVFRDNLMVNLHNKHKEYQIYSFDKHKGYGTKLHLDMLKKHGPCEIHRKSFKPIFGRIQP